METHGTQSLRRLAFSATAHCLTGCAIGEVLGMIIGTALDWSDVQTIFLAVVLAFVFGYSLTMRPLLAAGVAFTQAVRLALVADTVSVAIIPSPCVAGPLPAGVRSLAHVRQRTVHFRFHRAPSDRTAATSEAVESDQPIVVRWTNWGLRSVASGTPVFSGTMNVSVATFQALHRHGMCGASTDTGLAGTASGRFNHAPLRRTSLAAMDCARTRAPLPRARCTHGRRHARTRRKTVRAAYAAHSTAGNVALAGSFGARPQSAHRRLHDVSACGATSE